MVEQLSWREQLNKIISNPLERERIANEIGVRSHTLSRWISGESLPRPHNLRQLLNALPKQQRDELREAMEEELSDMAVSALTDTSSEIAYKFIMEVFDAHATMPDTLRYWSISRLVLEQAIRQLDPERVGMAITIVRCMPPTSDGKIHSLRESQGLGTPPWGGNLEQYAMFLGAESLAGHVAASCRAEAVQDLVKDRTFLPAYQTEHEVSAIAHPIMMAGRVAGCLLVSSTLPNYFLSQFRLSLVHGYANLLTLAFEPHEFYRPELIELRVMPPLDVQREHFASFRQRVLRTMMEYAATDRPLINIQAEELVWQELERILLRLPPQTGPSGLA